MDKNCEITIDANDKNGVEQKEQASYERNVITTLDMDFLQYLKVLQESREQARTDKEKKLVQSWCDKLLSEKRMSVTNKRKRNIFLSQLILAIKESRIMTSPVFSKPPQPLNSYALSVFGLAPFICNDNEPDTYFKNNENTLDLSNYKKLSKDKRTYMATKELADGSGFMAYIGLSTSPKPVWLDLKGNYVKPEGNESRDKTSSVESQQDTNICRSRTVVANQPNVCSRKTNLKPSNRYERNNTINR